MSSQEFDAKIYKGSDGFGQSQEFIEKLGEVMLTRFGRKESW